MLFFVRQEKFMELYGTYAYAIAQFFGHVGTPYTKHTFMTVEALIQLYFQAKVILYTYSDSVILVPRLLWARMFT